MTTPLERLKRQEQAVRIIFEKLDELDERLQRLESGIDKELAKIRSQTSELRFWVTHSSGEDPLEEIEITTMPDSEGGEIWKKNSG